LGRDQLFALQVKPITGKDEMPRERRGGASSKNRIRLGFMPKKKTTKEEGKERKKGNIRGRKKSSGNGGDAVLLSAKAISAMWKWLKRELRD